MGLEVQIDPAACTGSGNCGYWAPGVFDVGDDNIAVVIGDPEAQRDRTELAAQHCPTQAITLHAR